MLNLFRGGLHHNELHETADLVKPSPIGIWITQYAWTPEIVVGSVSGRQARVWVWKKENVT